MSIALASVKAAVLTPRGGYLVRDSFTRADNVSSLGNAETGQTWAPVNLNWGISSNRAYNTNTGGAHSAAVVDGGVSDGIIQVDISGVSAACWVGLSVRTDGTTSNLWRAFLDGTNVILQKVVSSATTTVASAADATVSGTVSVVLRGTSIEVYVGNIRRIAVTSIDLQANTKHGLYLANNGSGFLDNFAVRRAA